MFVIFGSGVGEIADDVDGSEPVSLTRTRRSVFFSKTWLLTGKFSVGTLPSTNIFRVGSVKK